MLKVAPTGNSSTVRTSSTSPDPHSRGVSTGQVAPPPLVHAMTGAEENPWSERRLPPKLPRALLGVLDGEAVAKHRTRHDRVDGSGVGNDGDEVERNAGLEAE